MSTVPSATQTTTMTVTAHHSNWFTIIQAILQAVTVTNPIIAQFIPAPVEAGIQVATVLGPVVAGTVEAATGAGGDAK